MKARTAAASVIALLSMAGEASAHAVLGITGFAGGLLHPLFVPTHILAVVALALLLGQQQRMPSLSIAYGVGLVAGLGAIALAYVPTFVEQALLALAGMVGLLVASARRLPWIFGPTVATATGLAIGLDSPPEAVSISEANVTLLGTALGATTLLVGLAWFASSLRHGWQRVGVRIIGSWIAASAIMVLALRLAGG
jgi:urease accessory protein